jgi:hypothetical protein
MMDPKEVSSRLLARGPRPANLHSLIELYHDNPELFYALATVGTDPESELARLAVQLRKVIRHGFQVMADPADGAKYLQGGADRIPLAGADAAAVFGFASELHGTRVHGRPGKDYAGAKASEAEVALKLGDPAIWQAERDRLRARDSAKPLVLRLDEYDRREVVSGMPGHVVYGLRHSATKLVQCATVMYRGLRREGWLRDGYAFCGRLRHAYNNAGHKIPAPNGKVYIVCATAAGCVFDWDWVEEDPHHPGYPIDPEARFTGNPEPVVPDAVLVGVDDITPARSFDSNQAWCSPQGDCIFCYFSDDLAYADWIDNDLTVFRCMGTKEPTGFKIKNVNRLLEEHPVNLDAPDLGVAIQSFLLASFHRNP